MEITTYLNPYINQRVRRIVTDVYLNLRHFHLKHKGVVYHVKHKGDVDETIVLAANHRWRDSYLMVVIREREVDSKEAHALLDEYVNRHLWCERCHRVWDGSVSFRFDIKGGVFVRRVCAYCDPTVDYIAGFFDAIERQISGGQSEAR